MRRFIAAAAPRSTSMGKTVILIDDGLATGSTMRAAVAALRKRDPSRIVVAVPIGASSTCAEFRRIADECICAVAPEHFRAVGLWYEDFAQTDDDEVCELLTRAAAREAVSTGHSSGPVKKGKAGSISAGGGDHRVTREPPMSEHDVMIAAGDRTVMGTLKLPGPRARLSLSRTAAGAAV